MQRGVGLLQRPLHDHDLSLAHDEPLQLGYFQLGGGFQINGLNVEDHLPHRQDDHLATRHLRPDLIPQGELLGDGRVLIDEGVDLRRTVDQLSLGEIVDDDLAVKGRIASDDHQGSQVVPPFGTHGAEQQKIKPGRRDQVKGQVVRGDVHWLLAAVDLCKIPHVLLLVKHLRVALLVLGVDRCLQGENVHGVADLGQQLRRHLGAASKEARIDPAVSGDDGVVGLEDVIIDRAVVGVHHDLHRVADVVRPVLARIIGCCVGVHVGGGVPVLNPVEALIGHDQIRVPVEGDERGEDLDAFQDVLPEQDAAVGIGLGREKDVPVAEMVGEHELLEEG